MSLTPKMDALKLELQRRSLPHVSRRGNSGSSMVLVGEAGGKDEAEKGVAFVGGSGRELDRMLNDSGLLSHECWFTNPYQTRPPNNDLSRLPELGIGDAVYLDAFWEELNQFKPTFIVACGAIPLGLLCPFTKKERAPYNAEITKWQGSLLTSPLVSWPHYVIPVLHPASILRNWEDRVVAVLCFQKAADELAFWRTHSRVLQPLPERKLIADPPADDAIDYLRGILALPPERSVSIDIENIGVYSGKDRTPQQNRLPYVVGFATSAREGISVGLAEYEKGKTEAIWGLIDQILRTRRTIGQNFYTHDAPWLRYIGFEPNIGLLDDTLVRHHVLWPELPHKLQFQTMQYTREPYYKDEGKNWTVKERLKMKRYNCKDVCVTYEVWERQEEEFKERA